MQKMMDEKMNFLSHKKRASSNVLNFLGSFTFFTMHSHMVGCR